MHGGFGDRGPGNPAVIGKIIRRIVRRMPPPWRHLMPDEDDHRHQETSADNERRHQYGQVLQHACPLPAVFARWQRLPALAQRSVSFGRERPPGASAIYYFAPGAAAADRGCRASSAHPAGRRGRTATGRRTRRRGVVRGLSYPAAEGGDKAARRPAQKVPPPGWRHGRCPADPGQSVAAAKVWQVSRAVPVRTRRRQAGPPRLPPAAGRAAPVGHRLPAVAAAGGGGPGPPAHGRLAAAGPAGTFAPGRSTEHPAPRLSLRRRFQPHGTVTRYRLHVAGY
jgi:hypothetical protein